MLASWMPHGFDWASLMMTQSEKRQKCKCCFHACTEITTSATLSAKQRYIVNMNNFLNIFKVQPIDLDMAKKCFSRAKYFQQVEDNLTMVFSKDYIISALFEPEFQKLRFVDSDCFSLTLDSQ